MRVRKGGHDVDNLPIRMTWGIPQEYWIQKRQAISEVQYSQIALRGDSQVYRMVAKSRDPLLFPFKIPQTSQNCASKLNMCGNATTHCSWCNILPGFLFFSSSFLLFLGLWMVRMNSHPRSLTRGSAKTPARNYHAGVFFPPPCTLSQTMRSVYREVRQVWRAASAAPNSMRRCGRGELRLRKFSSPPLILSSERKKGGGEKRGISTHFGDLAMLLAV